MTKLFRKIHCLIYGHNFDVLATSVLHHSTGEIEILYWCACGKHKWTKELGIEGVEGLKHMQSRLEAQ